MTTAILRVKRALLATGAAAALIMMASTANASCAYDDDDCDSSSVALYDDDDDDDDDDDRDFVYDENEGSLLVAIENCEPGKFWMMYTDMADDVMMPCR
jgi:hypothetical protein